DEEMLSLLETAGETLRPLVELGLNHEQQHQELLLTDLKHAYALNPLHPAYAEAAGTASLRSAAVPAALLRCEWHAAGVRLVGHDGAGFAFDNESPRHRAFVDAFRIASRLTTNGEYFEFIEAGGYDRPEFWLSDGWAARQREGWQ